MIDDEHENDPGVDRKVLDREAEYLTSLSDRLPVVAEQQLEEESNKSDAA